MLIRSRVKQTPPPPPKAFPVGSVRAQAVTGRRENDVIPCPSDATFRAATMRVKKEAGARLFPPPPTLPPPPGPVRGRGGVVGGWGGWEKAPPPARVFTGVLWRRLSDSPMRPARFFLGGGGQGGRRGAGLLRWGGGRGVEPRIVRSGQ